MKAILQSNRNILVLICLSWLIVKVILSFYGLPHKFHPDEASILKDPLKIAFKYFHGDFSASSNLLNWIILIWLSILFIAGFLFGKFESFEHFTQLIVSEDELIWLWGRWLMIIFSMIGLYYIYKLIFAQKHLSIIHKTLIFCTIIFSPVELISNMWIKMDAPVYAFACFYLYKMFLYFNSEYYRPTRLHMYLLAIIGLTIRIDTLAFLIAFLVIDFKNSKSNLNFRSIFKILFMSILVYSSITLFPFKFLFTQFSSEHLDLKVDESLTEVISKKFIANIFHFDFDKLIFTCKNYFIIGVTMLGLIPFHGFFSIKTSRRWLLIALLILLFPIGLLGHISIHYFLIVSTILFVLYIIDMNANSTKKWLTSYLLFNFLFILSYSFLFLYNIFYLPDTRIESGKYLLRNTGNSSVLLFEDYINPGSYPLVNECAKTLIEKSNATVETGLGSGKTLLAQAQNISNNNCRSIIGLSEVVQFENTKYENKWHITKDTLELRKCNAIYFVSIHDYASNSNDLFSNTVNQLYESDTMFNSNYIDIRIRLSYHYENFSPVMYVLKKKQHHH